MGFGKITLESEKGHIASTCVQMIFIDFHVGAQNGWQWDIDSPVAARDSVCRLRFCLTDSVNAKDQQSKAMIFARLIRDLGRGTIWTNCGNVSSHMTWKHRSSRMLWLFQETGYFTARSTHRSFCRYFHVFWHFVGTFFHTKWIKIMYVDKVISESMWIWVSPVWTLESWFMIAEWKQNIQHD